MGREEISSSNAPERGIKSVLWTQGERTKTRPFSVRKMEIHRPPWEDRCKPGADLRRCHRSEQWLARICSLVSRRAAKKKMEVLGLSLPLRQKEAIDVPTAQGTTGLTSAKIHIFLNFNVEESQRKGRGWRDGLRVKSNDCS